jgi:hypothetical protein
MRWLLVAVMILACGKSYPRRDGQVLVRTGESPAYLAVQGDYLYWTESDNAVADRIMRLPPTGGSAEKVATTCVDILDVIVGEAALYWACHVAFVPPQNELYRMPLVGGTAELAVRGQYFHDLVVVGDTLYFVDEDIHVGSGLHRRDPDGTVTALTAGSNMIITPLWVDESYVYFVNRGTTIFRVPIIGGAMEAVFSTDSFIIFQTMGQDEAALYASASTPTGPPDTEDAIVRIAKDGTGSQLLADELGRPYGALRPTEGVVSAGVVRGSDLLFLRGGGSRRNCGDDHVCYYDLYGRLERIATTGGVPEVILDGQRGPAEIAVAGHQVYVLNRSSLFETSDSDPENFPAIIVTTLPP